ncbi:MAG: sorbosone dehydrogenase family protein [Geobacteraceae bacterium]|nr:sorbosone dehydrogenase family protein [Geobacteraceae bacterium]
MKEISLHKLHRYVGIVSAPFMVPRTGSGLLLGFHPPPSRRCLALLSTALLLAGVTACHATELPLGDIALPPGFTIEVYSRDVPGARSMALGAKGTLFVGSRGEGKIYALVDKGNHREVFTIARGLTMPNGVAFRDGALYVAEVSRVLRFDDIEARLADPPRPVPVNDSFPDKKHHGWKFIRFGPDGKLYVPVGAPCNVCEEKDPRFATIMRLDPDGKNLEIFARGVRNTVGFDWHPLTRELWFTDNGRDWLGNDLPPDELNRARAKGLHFGFPYWHGREIPDPEFGRRMKKGAFVPPEMELGPHVAALGMRFYTGTMFPPRYRNQIFIAEHGSWNRSDRIGYRITLVRLEGNRAASYEVFAEGWLQEGNAWGRPVDLQVMPDGSLLVSDDKAGAIYRISYRHNAPPQGRK